jgi:hypothetical protein
MYVEHCYFKCNDFQFSVSYMEEERREERKTNKKR